MSSEETLNFLRPTCVTGEQSVLGFVLGATSASSAVPPLAAPLLPFSVTVAFTSDDPLRFSTVTVFSSFVTLIFWVLSGLNQTQPRTEQLVQPSMNLCPRQHTRICRPSQATSDFDPLADMLLVIFDIGFSAVSDHGPRASTEVTFTPGGHEPQTEVEQCPSELIGNFYWDRQEVFLEKRVYQGRKSNE